MKKIIKNISALIIMTVFFVLCNKSKINAANVSFYDYKDINKLSTKYSYGTLFYTDTTKIIPISYHWETSDKRRWGADAGEEFKLKITNCAVDEDNELCDVIITIDNIQSFKNYNQADKAGDNMFPGATFNSGERVVASLGLTSSFLTKNNETISCNSTGDLILFNLNLFYGTAEFTMNYYKAGTNTKANIKGTVALIFDIDIYTKSTTLYSSEYFNGCEALSPTFDSNVYYQKNGSLYTQNGGIGISKQIENVNYLANSTSCFVTQSQEARYSMKYGGCSCGILYCFASPYTFELNNPEINVDKSRVYEGEKFTYTISQYVPNNYYAGVINLIEGYNGLYSSFKIEDIINSNLTILDGIKVVNENNSDVTSYFDINVSDNKVTATLKTEYLDKREFYLHIYKVQVPVKFNKGVGKNIDSVSNRAVTIISSQNSQVKKDTEEVIVKLKYELSITMSIENGIIIIKDKEVTAPFDDYIEDVEHSSNSIILAKFKPNEGYEIEHVYITGKWTDIDTFETDSDGYYIYSFENNNINENIHQNILVGTTLIKGKVTITKVDKNDNTKLLSGAIYKIEKLDNEGNIDSTFTTIEKTTGENGVVEFTDLLVGKYRITEIKAPEGYELSSKSVEVEITKDIREQNIIATDRLKLILPETGGIKNNVLYIVGGIIICISIILKNIKLIKNV